MSKEPENLVLTLLREVRAEQGATRDDIRNLRDQMTAMRKPMLDWRETISAAAGFAMHANLLNQKIEADPTALRQRVEKLENAG